MCTKRGGITWACLCKCFKQSKTFRRQRKKEKVVVGPPGHGPPATPVIGGTKITNDIKAVIAAKHTHNLFALLRGLPKQHGATARALEQGDVYAEASEFAFKQLTTEA